MNSRDFLILTIYFISVSYVLYRAIQSVQQNEVEILLDQDFLKQQLEEQDLKDRLEIKISLAKRYQLDRLFDLTLSVENKTPQTTIEMLWDRSSLTDLERRARRMIRLTPSMNIDLSLPQVISVIAPGKELKEKVTAEDVLAPDAQTNAVKLNSPLIDLPKPKKGERAPKLATTLQFAMVLVFRLVDRLNDDTVSSAHMVSCNFTVQRLPWTDALRWKPNRKGKKAERS